MSSGRLGPSRNASSRPVFEAAATWGDYTDDDDDDDGWAAYWSGSYWDSRDVEWACGPDLDFYDSWWSDDEWPAATDVERWDAYERRWVAWERSNGRWWGRVGLDEDIPASWERGFLAWVARNGLDECVYCALNDPAYSDGSCRTCYRWLQRNRDRYDESVLFEELKKRIESRALSAKRKSLV